MTTYSRGDVIFVPFQFVEKQAAKNRPAVVISSQAFHESRIEVIITGITGNVRRHGLIGEFLLRDWHECGLAKPSSVNGILQTVRPVQLGRAVGRLTAFDMATLDASLKESLAL